MAASLAGSSRAHAEDAATAALAETLFRDGKALMAASKYDEACPKLEESYRIDPGTGTLLALAVCHEHQHKSATAWAEYNEVVAAAATQGRADRAQVARERLAQIEPHLSRLTIVVSPDAGRTPGLRVTRDGIALGEAAWGSAVPVDPGDHVVEATAESKKKVVKTVHVGARDDRQTVTIDALEGEPSRAAPAGPAPVPKEAAPFAAIAPERASHDADRSSDRGRPVPLVTYIFAGLGAAALGSFGYFGATGRTEYFDLKHSCGPYCSSSDLTGMRSHLIVADVSLGVSLVAFGVATYFFLARP